MNPSTLYIIVSTCLSLCIFIALLQDQRQHMCPALSLFQLMEYCRGTKMLATATLGLTWMWRASGGMHECGPGSSERAQCSWLSTAVPCRYNLTRWAIQLNEITPGLKEKLAPTDCRLRPDQHHLELGEYDQASLHP